MKRVIQTSVMYRCKVCRTDYRTKREAARCERFPVDPPIAKAGDHIRIKGKRECGKFGFPGKKYVARGKILRVLRLSPAVRWPGYELRKHEHTYLCGWQCPHCGESREQEFNPGELSLDLKAAADQVQRKRAG